MKFEDIKKEIEANEELQTQVLEMVTSTEKGKGLLENYATSYFEKNIGSKIAEVHNRYDADIEEVLGIKREPNEKTFEFNKRLLLKLKEYETSGKAPNEDMRKLQEELTKLKAADSQKDNLLTSKINELKSEYEAKISEMQSKYQSQKIESFISSAISSLKFNDSIPKVALDATKQAKINELMKAAKIDDKGNIIFVDENGQQLRNKLHAIMSIDEILKNELSELLASDKKGGAAASKAPKMEKTASGDDVLILDENTFSTKKEFIKVVYKAISQLGIAIGTAKADEIFDKAAQTYNYSNLK